MNELFKTNAYKFDPTRTIVLRRMYEAEMVRRFKRLRRAVDAYIRDQDQLGLKVNYDFRRDPDKLAGFMRWLKRQTDFFITEGPNKTPNNAWQSTYIQTAYQKGMGQAAGVLKGAGATVRDNYVSAAFFQPRNADRAGIIYTRAYNDLEGITAAMSTKMGRTLSRGIIEGVGVQELADQLWDDISNIGITRARVLARTEVIAAHAEGALNTYEAAKLEGVKVQSEFSTAGDEVVCPICEALEGKIYTVDEARGVIPVHPNCRCTWLPVVEDASDVVL